jgi:hypothetical protein
VATNTPAELERQVTVGLDIAELAEIVLAAVALCARRSVR